MKLNQLFTLFILFSIIVEPTTVGAATVTKVEAQAKSVNQLKAQVSKQTKEVELLAKEVNEVEVTLAINNKKYLQLAQERAIIEERLTQAKKNAQLDSEELEKRYNNTKKILMSTLLNKLEDTEKAGDLLARKILVKKLKTDLTDLEKLIAESNKAYSELEMLNLKLSESMQIEKDLINLMSDLESKKLSLKEDLEKKSKVAKLEEEKLKNETNKLDLAKKTLAKSKVREKLKPMQLTEKVSTKSSSKAVDVGFISPIKNYNNIEYQKKGVTYNFKDTQQVRATKSGTVVYTGELANYGNVLMIEHGNETRTVLLGQFDYTVKKGDKVQAGQSVGTTKSTNGQAIGEGKLYFEVRKNNLAQNTYLLLDKNTLAKQ